MELDTYLEKLRTCPDELLHEKCNVSDNWLILLQRPFAVVMNDLKALKSFRYKENLQNEVDRVREAFEYVPGTVILQADSYLWPIGMGMRRNPDYQKHHARTNDYSMTLLLHPYQKEKKIEKTTDERALAHAIEEVAKYIKANRIPACFPHSYEMRNPLETCDLSGIVYFP